MKNKIFFMSSRILLLLVPGQCCLTKLLPFFYSTSKNNSGSSSCTPSSKASLLASTFASNSNLDDQESQPPLYPTSNLTMSPGKFSTRNVRKALLQLNTSKSSGSDGIPAIVLKSFAPELALSSTSFSIFPTILLFSLPLGSLSMFPYPQKVTNLTHQTIALLQSLLSSLRRWRPLSPNNCLPSSTVFLTISTGLDKPDLPGTF